MHQRYSGASLNRSGISSRRLVSGSPNAKRRNANTRRPSCGPPVTASRRCANNRRPPSAMPPCCGRRDRVLRSVLAVTVVVACVASAAFFFALHLRSVAQQRSLDATAQKLVAEAQARLADTRQGDDLQALNELLAATKLASQPSERPLLDALVDRFSMHKVLQTPGPVIGVAYAVVIGLRWLNQPASASGIRASRTGGTPSRTQGHRRSIEAARCNQHGRQVRTGPTVAAEYYDGSSAVWNSRRRASRSHDRPGVKHQGRVTSVAFSL